MKQLGIEMIAAYSPEARGRSERAFAAHQDRLVKELMLAGITDVDAANRYIRETYLPAFNAEFCVPAREAGSAFVPWIGGNLEDTLCEQHERSGGHDNCVRFDNLTLQIPQDRYRCNYVKTKVKVRRYADSSLSVFHGPRQLARYSPSGSLIEQEITQAAWPARASAAVGGKPLRATPSAPFPQQQKTGQFMCYESGQF